MKEGMLSCDSRVTGPCIIKMTDCIAINHPIALAT
jgi:hypothetical protein